MQTVPYKGTALAMTDLIGGQVDLMCDQTTKTTTQIEGGKVKAYAVTTPKRPMESRVHGSELCEDAASRETRGRPRT